MILDTNALSALAEGVASMESILKEATELALPVIVLGEYKYGIRRSRFKARYESWLEEFLPSCRILPVDLLTVDHYASLRVDLHSKGTLIPGNDVWIAALARQHGYPILSRDTHFDYVPRLKRHSW